MDYSHPLYLWELLGTEGLQFFGYILSMFTFNCSDIISQGKTMEAFGLFPSYTIDEDTRDLEFFVSTSYQDAISLDKVVVTVEKPRVVSVRVNPNNPVTLSSSKTVSLQSHFVCMNDGKLLMHVRRCIPLTSSIGESLVVISLSFLYRPLEFSIIKKCRKPQLRRARGFTVYHATSIVVVIAVSIAAFSGYLFYRRTKRLKGQRNIGDYRPLRLNMNTH